MRRPPYAFLKFDIEGQVKTNLFPILFALFGIQLLAKFSVILAETIGIEAVVLLHSSDHLQRDSAADFSERKCFEAHLVEIKLPRDWPTSPGSRAQKSLDDLICQFC